MIHSIYHFFNSLVQQKQNFGRVARLDQFPFDDRLLSCRNLGVFPDLAIRVNKDKRMFTGGELIELKDSGSYAVSSFNSTIPSGSKMTEEIIAGGSSVVRQQMEAAGDDVLNPPIRDVFYLVRGRKNEQQKVCLVHGSFFETISVETLISQSFGQVLEERLEESGKRISSELQQTLISLLCRQQSFSRVRNVARASVKLRFRIMTEVRAEGNILNSKKYPEISDDTLNLVLPCHNNEAQDGILRKAEKVFGRSELRQFRIFRIKHHFNGFYLVLQTSL